MSGQPCAAEAMEAALADSGLDGMADPVLGSTKPEGRDAVNCYYCNQPMESGRFVVYGNRTVCVHKACPRASLLDCAYEMGLFTAAEERTDQELIDAIAAEKLSGEWLDRLEKLPTDEAKRDAVHRLRLSVEGP